MGCAARWHVHNGDACSISTDAMGGERLLSANNQKRPSEYRCNTERRTLGNFEAGSGRPEMFVTTAEQFRGAATKFTSDRLIRISVLILVGYP